MPEDLKEAPYWYKLAADQGDADAEFALAQLYRDGRGVPQDDLIAYKWFSRAAANSDASHRDDAINELYSIAEKLPAGTILDPPPPPEPFGRLFGRWFGRIIVAWIAIAIIVVIWSAGKFLFEIVVAKNKSTQQGAGMAIATLVQPRSVGLILAA